MKCDSRHWLYIRSLSGIYDELDRFCPLPPAFSDSLNAFLWPEATPSLASIFRPLPYGELPSLDLSNQEPLTHVYSKEPLLLRIVSTGPWQRSPMTTRSTLRLKGNSRNTFETVWWLSWMIHSIEPKTQESAITCPSPSKCLQPLQKKVQPTSPSRAVL